MHIATIVGARPQFIKAATVSRAIADEPLIAETIVHTGQHFDSNMSDVFFEELGIPVPDYHLGVSGGGHGAMTGVMLGKLEPLLQEIRPDLVLVYGDTNSTLAGALTAAKLHIPVAHVEAGLRSYNRCMPEEINRILTDQLSTILFCPSEKAVNNLRSEGFPHKLTNTASAANKIFQKSRQLITNAGDVMFDAALYYAKRAEGRSSILGTHCLTPKGYVLATVHRAENTDDPARLRAIFQALQDVARELPVVLPLHPRTRKKLDSLDSSFISGNVEQTLVFPVADKDVTGAAGLLVIDPVGYLDMVFLEKNAAVIATDSGGVQKEAYFHGVPCVTLREETEWTELVDSGWNRLAPPGKANISQTVSKAAETKGKDIQLYGTGNAAELIVNFLLDRYPHITIFEQNRLQKKTHQI